MGSIRLVYDAEGDILDVDFRLTGGTPRRGIELHNNITVWTDTGDTHVLRLMFLSYSQLCKRPYLSLAKLKKLPARQRTGFLRLLTSDPVRRFLAPVDEHRLHFRVTAPGVKEVKRSRPRGYQGL
jgi:hypothetical protein